MHVFLKIFPYLGTLPEQVSWTSSRWDKKTRIPRGRHRFETNAVEKCCLLRDAILRELSIYRSGVKPHASHLYQLLGVEMRCINHKLALNIKLGPIYMNSQGLSNERLPHVPRIGRLQNSDS
jgi:hypothetical protein